MEEPPPQMNDVQRKQINRSYKIALLETFKPKQDTLLLEVESVYLSRKVEYKRLYLTSLITDMRLVFDSGDFIKDFDGALLKGKELIASGNYNATNFEKSYNNFSYGIFISSTCDDFVEDSGKYEYIVEENGFEQYNVVGVRRI